MIARLAAILDALSFAVAGLATAAMVALVVLAVVMRYVVGAPLVYSYDLSVILFAWAVFAGLAVAEGRGAHLSVDLLDRALAPQAARVLFTLRQVALAALTLWFAWIGWQLVLRAGMTVPSLRISIRWLYAALPVGLCAMAAAQMLRAAAGPPVRMGDSSQEAAA